MGSGIYPTFSGGSGTGSGMGIYPTPIPIPEFFRIPMYGCNYKELYDKHIPTQNYHNSTDQLKMNSKTSVGY